MEITGTKSEIDQTRVWVLLHNCLLPVQDMYDEIMNGFLMRRVFVSSQSSYIVHECGAVHVTQFGQRRKMRQDYNNDTLTRLSQPSLFLRALRSWCDTARTLYSCSFIAGFRQVSQPDYRITALWPVEGVFGRGWLLTKHGWRFRFRSSLVARSGNVTDGLNIGFFALSPPTGVFWYILEGIQNRLSHQQ